MSMVEIVVGGILSLLLLEAEEVVDCFNCCWRFVFMTSSIILLERRAWANERPDMPPPMMATRFTRRAAGGDENPASSSFVFSVEGDENNGALLIVQTPHRRCRCRCRCRCRDVCDDGGGIDHAKIGLVILAAFLLDGAIPVLRTLSTALRLSQLLLDVDDEKNNPP